MAGLPIFLRWSFIRMGLGMKKFLTEWQVGDGREQGALDHVLRAAPKGNLDAVIAAIDEYAYRTSFLMNVGDEKGKILDSAIARAAPKRMLELGAYVGYSALRTARKLPRGGHLYSVEFNASNAAIARKMVEHAGVSDRVTFVVGTLGDGGKTLQELAERHGFAAGNLDLVFIDHDKDAYLPDLKRLEASGWLHAGSIAVADNVKFPGAPEYRAYMKAEEGKRWTTEEHETVLEYQKLISHLVLVSTFRA